MDRIDTPTNPAAPTIDVAQVLATLATLLLATPDAYLGHITVTRTVLDISGGEVSVTALRPVWEALPLGGHGDRGLTHAEYAELVLAEAANDSAMDEALRLARPSLAQQMLADLASSLQSEDPFEPLTLDTLNATLDGVAFVLTDDVPVAIAIDAGRRAATALPSIHPGETADAYALRLLHAARTV